MRRPRTANFQRANSAPNPAGPSAPFLGSPWLDPPTISSSGSDGAATHGRSGRRVRLGSSSFDAGAGGGSRQGKQNTWKDTLMNLLFQLVFWPLTLSLMLGGSAYRFLLRVGCPRSPLRFREPPRWLVRAASKPFRLVNPPVSLGTENLEACSGGAKDMSEDGRREGQGGGAAASRPPVLLVGNHNLLGLDCLPMLDEVQRRAGVYPRVLYDTLFGFVPGGRQLVEAAGGVKGTKGNCEALMSEGRCLLLYPGGAREAFKGGRGDKYQLMWHDKLGFARMAVKYGYSVLPFASVGLEDAVSVAFGLDVTWLVRRAEPDRGPLRIPFLYPYNSLQRQYFAFGEPVETAHFGGDWENLAKCTEVYMKVKGEVERLVRRLQEVQEQDPDRFLLRRTWRACRRVFGGLDG